MLSLSRRRSFFFFGKNDFDIIRARLLLTRAWCERRFDRATGHGFARTPGTVLPLMQHTQPRSKMMNPQLHTAIRDRAGQGMRAVLTGVLVNASLAIVKIISGVVGNSYALIADGIESTLDIFSTTVVWGGLQI
ncbi:MAG: cation transporter, partial [candidate division KSB1 bacterium]|nr:cation transporter [candidate division KSB1 bacterium]